MKMQQKGQNPNYAADATEVTAQGGKPFHMKDRRKSRKPSEQHSKGDNYTPQSAS